MTHKRNVPVRLVPHSTTALDIIPVAEKVVEVAVEVVRGYTQRQNLRTMVEAEQVRCRELRANADQVLGGYQAMSPEMSEETKRQYHEQYLALLVEGRFGGGDR